MISKGLLVFLNSPKKRTNKFVFSTMTNSLVRFLGVFEETKKSFRNYLTFNNYERHQFQNSPLNKSRIVLTIDLKTTSNLIFACFLSDEVNNSHLFNDTTRIRMNSRPSIRSVLVNFWSGFELKSKFLLKASGRTVWPEPI